MVAAKRTEVAAEGPCSRSVEDPPRAALTPLSRTLVLCGIFLAVLMGAMDGLVVGTVLPTIAVDLHQVNGVTFVVSAYLVSSTIAIPIFARLSDISSRRNVFLAGLAVFIAGSALAGLSQNLTELIVFRGIQGFGGGGVFPVAVAMVTVLFPPETRTRAIAVLGASSGVSIAAGPLLGSYIVSITTWRWVFYINLPFGFAALAVLLLAVGPLRAPTGERFDVLGAGLMTGWVAALILALFQVANSGWGWTDLRIVALLGGAAVLFAGFLAWELRVEHPLVPLRLLRRPVIASASGIMLFMGVVFSALITFLSLFVGIVLHDPASDVRDMIYFFAAPMLVGIFVAGALLNRVQYRALVLPGILVSGLAGLLLDRLTSSTPLWSLRFGLLLSGGIALPLIPMGFGLGMGLAGAMIAVQNDAPTKEIGAANGLIRFFQSLGGALGISLLTIFQTWRLGQLSSGVTTPDGALGALVHSYDDVFLILALLVFVAFVCSFWLTGRVPSSRSPPKVPIATGRSAPSRPGD